MVFLFQISAPGANQLNSIKAQVQCETIEPYRFLMILCSVPDVSCYIGKTGLTCHHFTLHVSTGVYGSRILSSLHNLLYYARSNVIIL